MPYMRVDREGGCQIESRMKKERGGLRTDFFEFQPVVKVSGGYAMPYISDVSENVGNNECIFYPFGCLSYHGGDSIRLVT